MYLDRIKLTNFKCFSDQEFKLAPLTLLLGANSSGKTSILYGLLAALQSDQFPLSLNANGPLAQLGDFRAFAHGRRIDRQVSIRLQFSDKQSTIVADGCFALDRATNKPVTERGELSNPALSITVDRDEDKYRASWKYEVGKDIQRTQLLETEKIREFFIAADRLFNETTGKKKPADPEDEIDFFAPPPPEGKLTFAKARDAFARLQRPRTLMLSTQLSQFSSLTSNFADRFNYIGSFRLEPKRTYYQVSKGNLKVNRDGENYIEQIAEWQETKSPNLSALKRAMDSLRLLSGIRTQRLPSGLFDVRVRPHRGPFSVSLADTGFGIGQLLPILVADLQLPEASTLAVSQPEIHLHPSVQADLADHFVKRMKSTRNRYIVETHSEYFLNRLRLLVAKGTIKPEDLSIIYLNNDGAASTPHQITFLPSGKVDGAPKDFFETYMVDVMNIALSAKPS